MLIHAFIEQVYFMRNKSKAKTLAINLSLQDKATVPFLLKKMHILVFSSKSTFQLSVIEEMIWEYTT